MILSVEERFFFSKAAKHNRIRVLAEQAQITIFPVAARVRHVKFQVPFQRQPPQRFGSDTVGSFGVLIPCSSGGPSSDRKAKDEQRECH